MNRFSKIVAKDLDEIDKKIKETSKKQHRRQKTWSEPLRVRVNHMIIETSSFSKTTAGLQNVFLPQ